MAQELLLNYGRYISKLTLVPSDRGRYEVFINGQLVYSKVETKVFPPVEDIIEKVTARIT